jgi:hypothetical protein
MFMLSRVCLALKSADVLLCKDYITFYFEEKLRSIWVW